MFCPLWVHTRSFGDLGLMSGLPESGHDHSTISTCADTGAFPRRGKNITVVGCYLYTVVGVARTIVG